MKGAAVVKEATYWTEAQYKCYFTIVIILGRCYNFINANSG
jgi:hypothetical protein